MLRRWKWRKLRENEENSVFRTFFWWKFFYLKKFPSKNGRFCRLNIPPRVPYRIFTLAQKYYPQGQNKNAEFDRSADFIDEILPSLSTRYSSSYLPNIVLTEYYNFLSTWYIIDIIDNPWGYKHLCVSQTIF